MNSTKAINYLNELAFKLRVEGVEHSKSRQLKLQEIADYIQHCEIRKQMKPICIIFGDKKPFIGFSRRTQWDMSKQPFIAIFYRKTEIAGVDIRQRTDRIFTLGGKENV